MQALFLASLDGGKGSPGAAFFRDLTGEEAVAALELLLFLAGDSTAPAAEATVPFFLRFFTEDLGSSGEVDILRSGS